MYPICETHAETIARLQDENARLRAELSDLIHTSFDEAGKTGRADRAWDTAQ